MNILLINPELPFQDGPKNNISLGLLFLGSYLKSKRINVTLKDYNAVDFNENEFKTLVKENDFIGFSIMTSQIPHALKLAKIVKESNKILIAGGFHPTMFPKQIIDLGLFDFSVIGEGEVTLYELVIALENKSDLSKVKGIAYKKNDKFKINEKRDLLKMEDLPPLDYSLLGKSVVKKLKDLWVPIATSRGCPHRCSFCINRILKDNQMWRSWNAIRVIKEIKNLVKLGANKFFFWDDNFYVNKKRVEEICDLIVKNKLKIKWFSDIRADYFREGFIDKILLKKIRKAGGVRFGIGAESGSQRVLNYLRKDISIDNLINSAKLCNEVNIEPTYSFIIGLPNESESDVKKTIDVIRRISIVCPKAKFLGPQLFRPYPGSDLYKTCLEYGWDEPKTLNEWNIKISKSFAFNDFNDSPWLKNKNFFKVVWFYSILLTLDRKRINYLFDIYSNSTKKSGLVKKLFKYGLYLLILMGKFRYKTNFYYLPIEVNLLRKYRSILSE